MEKRDKIENTEFTLISIDGTIAILYNEEEKKHEEWVENNNFAGYTIEINGTGYEFVRTL